MSDMLSFILITIIFFISGACALKTFWAMTREGGALDEVFGWQNMLKDLYASQSKAKNMLGKALGDCEQCTAFWFTPLWYALYYGFCKLVLDFWITDNLSNWLAIIFINWVWMAVFWSIGAVFGLLVLLKKKKDAV